MKKVLQGLCRCQCLFYSLKSLHQTTKLQCCRYQRSPNNSVSLSGVVKSNSLLLIMSRLIRRCHALLSVTRVRDHYGLSHISQRSPSVASESSARARSHCRPRPRPRKNADDRERWRDEVLAIMLSKTGIKVLKSIDYHKGVIRRSWSDHFEISKIQSGGCAEHKLHNHRLRVAASATEATLPGICSGWVQYMEARRWNSEAGLGVSRLLEVFREIMRNPRWKDQFNLFARR